MPSEQPTNVPMEAGGQILDATANLPQAEAITAVQDALLPSAASFDEDCNDLYDDVSLVGFIPHSPPSPSSPPKTPSPGHAIPTPPHPDPIPIPTSKPQPRSTPQPPTIPPTSTTALFIGDLHWWTTDAEIEAALAPHGALCGLRFFADKLTGKSRGLCRADFLHPAAAAAASAELHGRAFHGRPCVASLSPIPELPRPCADVRYPLNPNCGRGNGRRGNVGPALGGRGAAPPLPRLPMVPLRVPPPFGGMMGCHGSGYGGFPALGQCNTGMVGGALLRVVPPHVNPAFFAASGMALGGAGIWHGTHDQRMGGGFWGGNQLRNFGGGEMPWQKLKLRPPPQQQQSAGYGKKRVMAQDELYVTNEKERDNDNGREGGDRFRECDREERGQYREPVFEKERKRERERHWDEGDRHGSTDRKHQGRVASDDWERRGPVRSRSPLREDDHPRRRH